MKQIPLSSTRKHKNYGKYHALVDDEDFDWLMKWRWSYNRHYAVRLVVKNGTKQWIHMHRLILGIRSAKIEGDHIDQNKLNNQRGNLRKATHQQNSFNKPPVRGRKYAGVYYEKDRKKWRCNISNGKTTLKSNRFDNEIDAAKWRDEKAKELHGSFAYLNFKN